jgi:hypothetical protein
MPLDTVVAFDIIAFVIAFVSLLTSSPMIWHNEHFEILACSKEYALQIMLSLFRNILLVLITDV